MAKVAIIGTGIAGLSATYHLNRHHEVTVYERDPYVGGHTRTRVVNHGGCEVPVDTGFIVFNERNYPNLTALFRELGVAVEKSNMSFALTVGNGWLEWGAEGGLPFACVWLVFVAGLWRPAIRSIWGMGVVALFLHALVDYPFARPGIAAWAFILAGALYRPFGIGNTRAED